MKEERSRVYSRLPNDLKDELERWAKRRRTSTSEAIRILIEQGISPEVKKDKLSIRLQQIDASLKLLVNRKGYDEMMGQVELIGELVASSMMAADYHDKEAETDPETALEFMEERYRMFIAFVHARHKEGKLLDDLEKEKRKPS